LSLERKDSRRRPRMVETFLIGQKDKQVEIMINPPRWIKKKERNDETSCRQKKKRGNSETRRFVNPPNAVKKKRNCETRRFHEPSTPNRRMSNRSRMVLPSLLHGNIVEDDRGGIDPTSLYGNAENDDQEGYYPPRYAPSDCRCR